MKNLKEFKALIERYETIELKDIKEASAYYNPCKELTGFGSWYTCTLCKAVTDNNANVCCSDCVYGPKSMACAVGTDEAEKTYCDIDNAETPKQLLTAYRNRAKFMRKLLREKINALKGGENGKGS